MPEATDPGALTQPEILDLARRFEPVIRYARGELFLPSPVEEYVAGSQLLVREAGRRDYTASVAAGDLDLAGLSEESQRRRGAVMALNFVQTPLTRAEYRAWRRSPEHPSFTASSRFAAVGLASRIIDTVMRLTLIVRGRVPKGYAAAAHLKVAAGGADRHPYYVHASRDAGFTVLQYWFFYAMNDWRSSFGGVNDHEADWEQVTIYLSGEGPDARIEWIAFSSHDEVGDDLRRRVDDPDITWVDGTHAVVYAGAGSHSGAYLPGEYVLDVSLPMPSLVSQAAAAVARVLPWTRGGSAIGVPYIDYRRGDGHGVGPGESRQWTPVVIDDDTPWVRDYTGLWGLDTQDPLGGERAPAGPRYERDGRLRASWMQPVAWAGLDKVGPTGQDTDDRVAVLRERLEQESERTEGELAQAIPLLRSAEQTARAWNAPGGKPAHSALDTSLRQRVADLRRRQADLRNGLTMLERTVGAAPLAAGPHDHLRTRAVPLAAVEAGARRQRLLRLWSAASASLLLGAAGVILLWGQGSIVGPLLVLAAVMIVVEAAVRGRLLALAVNAAVTTLVVVAVVGLLWLAAANLRFAIGAVLLAAALYILWQTLAEGLGLRSRGRATG